MFWCAFHLNLLQYKVKKKQLMNSTAFSFKILAYRPFSNFSISLSKVSLNFS